LDGQDSNSVEITEYDDLIGLEINSDNYDKCGKLYNAIYDTVEPYMVTNAYYHLKYPDFDLERQKNLLYYVALGMKDDHFDSSFGIADYMNKNTGVYTLPKELFDEAMNRHLSNLALNEEALIEDGCLLPDKSAYTFKLDGFGLAGIIKIGDITEHDGKNIGLRLDVAFYENEPPTLFISFDLESVSEEYYRIVKVSSGEITAAG
jgi:hypothetical protein